MSFFKNWKKPTLREKCLEMYGVDFVNKYDRLASGEAVGNYKETIDILNKVEAARKELKK